MLYVLANNGVFDAYDLKTGAEIYRQRLSTVGNGFSASPVAADGKIYLSNEDGDIIVVAAGPEFKQIAVNSMGELLMATPALSAASCTCARRAASSRSGRDEFTGGSRCPRRAAGAAGKLHEKRPRAWGKMTPHEMMCHLADSFEVGARRAPRASRDTWMPRTFVRRIALHTTLAWPKGIRRCPRWSQGAGGTRPTEFEADPPRLIS